MASGPTLLGILVIRVFVWTSEMVKGVANLHIGYMVILKDEKLLNRRGAQFRFMDRCLLLGPLNLVIVVMSVPPSAWLVVLETPAEQRVLRMGWESRRSSNLAGERGMCAVEITTWGSKMSLLCWLLWIIPLGRGDNHKPLDYCSVGIATGAHFEPLYQTEYSYLRFGRHRSDTCGRCDLLQAKMNAASKEGRKHMQQKLELHHRKAEKARGKMKVDIIDSQRRGGNVIASVLLNLLMGRFVNIHSNAVIWCDNCIGQNKNQMVLFVMMLLVSRRICEIFEQRVLISGHSYLPCDQDFGVIEEKKVIKTYMPADISKMIEEARHDQPFKTIDIDSTDFKSVPFLSKKYLNTPRCRYQNGVTVERLERMCTLHCQMEMQLMILLIGPESYFLTNPIGTLEMQCGQDHNSILQLEKWGRPGAIDLEIPCDCHLGECGIVLDRQASSARATELCNHCHTRSPFRVSGTFGRASRAGQCCAKAGRQECVVTWLEGGEVTADGLMWLVASFVVWWYDQGVRDRHAENSSESIDGYREKVSVTARMFVDQLLPGGKLRALIG
ncbi:hypothetical protein PR048_011240 [Dryococelus australis]|uniref:DUF7869 domain-containing protein n=1 Tax=Dryococelus australis TaxID=614101 RepID=A0ABQ9HL22_9NEOP|nr:hypothetical protein PR048_011240 [Dryococelus australis]